MNEKGNEKKNEKPFRVPKPLVTLFNLKIEIETHIHIHTHSHPVFSRPTHHWIRLKRQVSQCVLQQAMICKYNGLIP